MIQLVLESQYNLQIADYEQRLGVRIIDETQPYHPTDQCLAGPFYSRMSPQMVAAILRDMADKLDAHATKS